MSYIKLESSFGDDHVVWIYTQKGAPMYTHAIVIGSGPTKLEALMVAAADLRDAVDQINALALEEVRARPASREADPRD